MQPRKVFTCQACDAEIEIANPQDQQQVACRQCGRNHRLRYSAAEQSWILRVEQPVEEDVEQHPQDDPFTVLGEVGRPKPVDRAEKHREQTDVHPGDEAVAKRPERKP